MSKLSDFTINEPRPLPVIILADTSGSMSVNGKIEALNSAIEEMIGAFRFDEDGRAEIHVSVITFGGIAAQVHLPLTPAHEVVCPPLAAHGPTPMGHSFQLATSLIEDREQVPSRAYTPAIILISDGVPTDDWERPLAELLASERATRAARFALAIGDDANRDTLKAFLDHPENRVFEAHEADEIHQFFQFVTMSVTQRMRSRNPDEIPATSPMSATPTMAKSETAEAVSQEQETDQDREEETGEKSQEDNTEEYNWF